MAANEVLARVADVASSDLPDFIVELAHGLLHRQPSSAQILTADSVQQPPIATPGGSEINHGIHRNPRKRESESTPPFQLPLSVSVGAFRGYPFVMIFPDRHGFWGYIQTSPRAFWDPMATSPFSEASYCKVLVPRPTHKRGRQSVAHDREPVERAAFRGSDGLEPPKSVTVSKWLPALAGGVRTAGFPDIADKIWRAGPGAIEARMAFYGDLFLRPGAMGLGAEELSPEQAELAEQLSLELLERAATRASNEEQRRTAAIELVYLRPDPARRARVPARG